MYRRTIAKDRLSRLHEGKDQRGPGFTLGHVEPVASPIERVQREGDDLARTQAVRDDEGKHGVVPEALRGAAITRLQQTPNGRPRQTAGQLLPTIDARSIDLPSPDECGRFDYEGARKDLRIPDEFQVEAMAAVGKPAPKELLPEKLQARESPNDRRKLSESIFEGSFKSK